MTTFSMHARRTLLGAALLFAGLAHADGTTPHYLDDSQLRAAQIVLAPPSPPGSPEDLADRAITERIYAEARGRNDAALAKHEETFDVFAFAQVLGPNFDAKHLPHTAALFTEVQKETAKAVKEAKDYYQRARPCPLDACSTDPEGDAKSAKKKSFGYPSGHSSRAAVFAALLGKLLPQKTDALAMYAHDVGWRRVVRGAHTPQDIYAGRVFGQALARDFLANPNLQHDLDEAAAELKAAGIAE
ncbi:phosphatase PAP2 family protein [Dyella tabacisoli]|uniref:Acid phosphatase n=1 Tax=Dyella tabacisoli TaxID=2282381 RepID=A0A369UHL9_9GAMM|nr:phosphatase PAP2 family protein [Dyella tabacisoli]RDD80252.1 phosphatase PAP2 family protein [Dyella tabacisoli]